MKPTLWLKLTMAMVALLAIGVFAVACGGDDDDDGGNGSNDATSTTSDQATPDNSDSGDSGDSGDSNAKPTDADKKYVSQICKATAEFFDAIKNVKPEDLTDESKALDIMKKPMQDYVKAMEDADPPKDAKSYHDQAVKQLKDTLKAVEDGDENAFDKLSENELPDPPAGLAARLEAAAQDNKDCDEVGFSF